jgi:hypothetical protein
VRPLDAEDIRDVYMRVFVDCLPTVLLGSQRLPDVSDSRVSSVFGHLAKVTKKNNIQLYPSFFPNLCHETKIDFGKNSIRRLWIEQDY